VQARADLKLSQTMGNVSNIFKYNAPFKEKKSEKKENVYTEDVETCFYTPTCFVIYELFIII